MIKSTDYEIKGNDLQALSINLNPGISVLANPGNLVYTSSGVDIEAILGGETFGSKLLNGFKRVLTGENFFLQEFKGFGEIMLSSPVPGKILPINLSDSSIICEKRSYLCSDATISIAPTITKKIGAGIFGQEGFILQKLSGSGTVFIQGSGTIIKKYLNRGESINLEPGCITAFDSTVDYDIKYVGRIKLALFGGTGLFFATLTGPGNVYIQTLPLNKLTNNLLSSTKNRRLNTSD